MKIKFPVGDEVGEVVGDQFSSQRCYVDTVKITDRLTKKDYVEKEDHMGKKLKSSDMMEKEPEDDSEVLRGNAGMFAFHPSYLTGINLEVAMHYLNEDPNARPVMQKLRHFGPEKDNTIREEVWKLLGAEKVEELRSKFEEFRIEQIPRTENEKAYYLAKLASSSEEENMGNITLLSAKEKSLVLNVGVMEKQGDWRTHIVHFLEIGKRMEDLRLSKKSWYA
ncbi:hypothetical protein ACS0TY_017803 [Phlomoides rotata]